MKCSHPEICLCRCVKLVTACEICKASVYQDLSPWEIVHECLTKSLEVFSSLLFSGELLCFLEVGEVRPSGNHSCVEDLISHTSVWEGVMQTMLPSVLDAISPMTSDSTPCRNTAVFTGIDMLQKLRVNHHLSGLSHNTHCFVKFKW